MKATLLNYQDNWQAVKDAAMNTIGKEGGKYPSSGWKRKEVNSFDWHICN